MYGVKNRKMPQSQDNGYEHSNKYINHHRHLNCEIKCKRVSDPYRLSSLPSWSPFRRFLNSFQSHIINERINSFDQGYIAYTAVRFHNESEIYSSFNFFFDSFAGIINFILNPQPELINISTPERGHCFNDKQWLTKISISETKISEQDLTR